MRRIDVHRKLVDAYRKKCPAGWADGTDDGYFYQHLPEHLLHSGLHDELRTLLFDARWLQAKMQVAGVASLFADFRLLPTDPDLAVAARSLRLCLHVVIKEPAALMPQMLSRLGAISPRLGALMAQASGHAAAGFRPIRTAPFHSDSAVIATFKMHDECPDVLAIDAAGIVAASASRSALVVWTVADGSYLSHLIGHEAQIVSLAFFPNGELLASASMDCTVRVWEYRSGRCLMTFRHDEAFMLLAVDASSEMVYAIASDGKLFAWTWPEGRLAWRRELLASTWRDRILPWRRKVPHGPVRCMALCDVLGMLVLLTESGDMVVSGLDPSRQSFRVPIKGTPLAAAIAPSGTTCAIAFAHRDGGHRIEIWDLVHMRPVADTGGRACAVEKLAYTPDGACLVAGAFPKPQTEHHMQLWQRGQTPLEVYRLGLPGELVLATTIRAHEGGVRSVHMARSAFTGISCGGEGLIRIWDVQRALAAGKDDDPARTAHGPSIPFPTGGHRIAAVVVNEGGDTAVSIMDCGRIQTWNAHDGTLLRTIRHWEGGDSMLPAPSLCMVAGTGTVLVAYTRTVSGLAELNWNTGEIAREFAVPTIGEEYGDEDPLITAIALTRTGTIVAACLYDELLRWEYRSGRQLDVLRGGNVGPSAPNHVLLRNPLAASPTSDLLVWANCDEQLQVLDTLSWTTLSRTERHCQVATIQLLFGSAQVLAAAWSKGLFIWDIQTGSVSHQFTGHDGNVEWVAVTADGELAFSCADDMTVQAWHLPTRRRLGLFQSDSMLTACATSPDGQIVVVGTTAGDLEFLRFARPLREHFALQ
jgi:WD40 repeat protein